MTTWFKIISLATTAMLVTSTGFAVEGAKKSSTNVMVAEATTTNVATDAGSTAAIVNVESDQKYLLGIDIRPSYYPTNFNATPGTLGGDKYGIEYTAWAGIQLTKDTSFIYEQYINTVGSTPNATMNLEPKMMEGAARVLVNNLWTSDKLGLALSYENRTLLPWRRDLRDRNRVLANRNYVKLKKTFSENFNLTLMEVPIAFVHTTPNQIIGGKNVNNEAFQNRIYLVPTGTMMDGKLTLTMPMWLSSTTRRDESKFTHELILWPEIDYAIDQNFTVGVAFLTGSIVKPNFDGFQIGQGFTDGESQLVFRASL